jgi:hypothetical protein
LDWRYNIMSTTAVTPAPPSSPAPPTQAKSQRVNLSNIYKPVGPKIIQTGLNAAPGQYINLSQVTDLSLPIRGIRFRYQGRCVVGTAGMASTTPEGFLNMISNITLQGTNARQKGNVTLWSLDLATLFGILHLVSAGYAAYYSINAQAAAGEVQLLPPGMPYSFGTTAQNTYNPTGTTGTYDYRIIIDIPFHPFASQAFGEHPHWVPAFLVRNEEWKDSFQESFTFPLSPGGAVAGPLGTGGGTTTLTFTSYGSGAGNPTLDVYSLPIEMGLDLKDQVYPGIISRTATPINSILQSAGNNVTLLNMQKQPTPRVFFKNGTGTAPPAMATLSDVNVTSLGILLGANRNVRNVVDVYQHKALAYDDYQRSMIQGYVHLDFMDSGDPDSAYPGQNIGDGSTFQLTANVAGVANAQGIIVQEQTIHTPTGPLYTY